MDYNWPEGHPCYVSDFVRASGPETVLATAEDGMFSSLHGFVIGEEYGDSLELYEFAFLPEGWSYVTSDTGWVNTPAEFLIEVTRDAIIDPADTARIVFYAYNAFGQFAGMAEIVVHDIAGGSCCGAYTGGRTGNANCSSDGKRTLSDISRMIDYLYISKAALCCEENGNVNGDAEGDVTLSDISRLIDYIFISKAETAWCPWTE
jgi:hypothetical protein